MIFFEKGKKFFEKESRRMKKEKIFFEKGKNVSKTNIEKQTKNHIK